MLTFSIALLLLSLTLFGILLRKTYDHVPLKELKRQARNGDHAAKVLYRAVAYGASLRLLLWLMIGLAAAGGFVLFVRVAPPLLAFLAVAGVLWYGFAWVPAARISTIGARAVVAVTPAIARVLGWLHPILSAIARRLEPRRPGRGHTGLYQREDLIDLLQKQRHMAGSRINDEEIDMAIHALTFGDRTVSEIMVPRRAVKLVDADDLIGPVLMDELHDSGFSRFPVFKDGQDNITGTLYLRDLISSRQGGKVQSVARRDVCYAHEDQALYDVLHAFIKTKHHLFIVINDTEEFVGIATIEDVLEQVIGHKLENEFDQYDNKHAVAASQTRRDQSAAEPITQTVTEVVE